MCQVASEIELPIGFDLLSFKNLRHYFGEQDRFGKVF